MTVLIFVINHPWIVAAVLFVLAISVELITREPDKWVPRRCTWPFKSGWCTYNPRHNTILDTGLTYEEAKAICDVMNKEAKCRKRTD